MYQPWGLDKEPQETSVKEEKRWPTSSSWGSLYMDYERLIASHSLFHVAIGEQLISPNKEPQRLCPLLRLVAMKQTVSDSRLKTLVMDERSEGNVGGYRKCFRTLVLGLWPEAFSTPTFTSFIHRPLHLTLPSATSLWTSLRDKAKGCSETIGGRWYGKDKMSAGASADCVLTSLSADHI